MSGYYDSVKIKFMKFQKQTKSKMIDYNVIAKALVNLSASGHMELCVL
jgi:hypothetical protein